MIGLCCYHIDMAVSTQGDLAAQKVFWYKTSCLLTDTPAARKAQA
jgi:hypothetical protein